MLLYTATLKDGRKAVIKEFDLVDKEKLFEMYESLSGEAVRWGMPPYTRDRIERGWLSTPENFVSLVAFSGGRIVGHAQLFKNPQGRRKGVADLLMYLHQEFHNVGLGTAMLAELLQLGRKEELHRIGLHVVADNKRAVHLYDKFGFKVEGILKESYFGEDEKYHDEIVMGLIL